MSRPSQDRQASAEITPEMIEAGKGAVFDVIGTEPLYQGEAEKIVVSAYRAMQRVKSSR